MSPREKDRKPVAPMPPMKRDPMTLDMFPDLLPATPVVHRVPVRAHRRRVHGEAPPDGETKKERAIASHEANAAKARALDYIRGELVKLWRLKRQTYPTPTVDADDAWVILHNWADCPQAVRDLKTNAFMGAVFKKGFRAVGTKASQRENTNGRLIQTWEPISP